MKNFPFNEFRKDMERIQKMGDLPKCEPTEKPSNYHHIGNLASPMSLWILAGDGCLQQSGRGVS